MMGKCLYEVLEGTEESCDGCAFDETQFIGMREDIYQDAVNCLKAPECSADDSNVIFVER